MQGLQPVAGVCTKFVECYKGTATIKDCPPGTHFCVKSLMCDWPNKVVCDQMTVSMTQSSSIHRVTSSVSSKPNGQSENYGGGSSLIAEQQPEPDQQTASDEQYTQINWSGKCIYTLLHSFV